MRSVRIVTIATVLAAQLARPLHAAPGDANRRLARYYGSAAGYRQVKSEVLAWHKTTRNGCVAFVSTALRQVGVPVPQDELRDGLGVSRITSALSGYLIEALGWQRIDDLAALADGDVVFTRDDACCVGVPEHVFVFLGWHDRRRRIATVIDNQGWRHHRALVTPAGHPVAAFHYALRAP